MSSAESGAERRAGNRTKTRLAAALILCLLVAGLWKALQPVASGYVLEHDAYVWQVRWTDALRSAISGNRDHVRYWRVLTAHVDKQGRLSYPAVDLPALVDSGRPMVAVVRIEGDIEKFDRQALLAGIEALHGRLRAARAVLAGIEVDHDCATAHLSRYAVFLQELRAGLGRQVPLSITALPAWMASPELPGLLRQADEAVLQVHAVQNPLGGLFEPRQAHAWITRFARYERPFRVALPTYGTQVRFDEHGNPDAVESEMPLLLGGGERRELSVSPVAVQGLLKALQDKPVPRLRGIAWFRLPTADDRRAWHADTWRQVMQGKALTSRVEVLVRPAEPPGLYDILLRNGGGTDADIPARIGFPEYCSVADGIKWYAYVTTGNGNPYLDRVESRLLGPGRGVVVGWVRCNKNPEKELDIAP